jgi:hypothetical protein
VDVTQLWKEVFQAQLRGKEKEEEETRPSERPLIT